MSGTERLYKVSTEDEDLLYFGVIKQEAFAEEISSGKSIKFVYQGKMIDDEKQLKEIQLQYPQTVIHAIISRVAEEP